MCFPGTGLEKLRMPPGTYIPVGPPSPAPGAAPPAPPAEPQGMAPPPPPQVAPQGLAGNFR